VIFGFSGFVIGPIITALLLAIWKMHEQYEGVPRPPDGPVPS
jgi:predicted PurR-regulated permease PerM